MGVVSSLPLLSICVPTCNRADLLRSLLADLAGECAPFEDLIEVVVSDNASEDNTREVVEGCGLKVVYGRNSENIGFCGNLINVSCNLASGEYVWIIGDDDVVLPGGVGRVVESILKASEVDFHYVNFGWIGWQLRKRLVQNESLNVNDYVVSNFQCDVLEWRRLSRLEDLTFLPSKNPSALFSGIFSFVTKRQFYLDAKQWLRPTRSLDGSSVHIHDCFPHAMLSVPRVSGREIAYIGEPCLLQCVGGWEWGAYANKNMIFGTYQLFEWLEGTSFAKDAMNKLWQSYYDMAGRLFSRMQCYPDQNKGFDIVMQKALPGSVSHDAFWSGFMAESKAYFEMNYESVRLSEILRDYLSQKPGARIGLWGVLGRGYHFIRNVEDLHESIALIVDRDTRLHGDSLGDSLPFFVSSPDTITVAGLDCLVVATRRDYFSDVIAFLDQNLSGCIDVLTVDGVSVLQCSAS